MFSEITVPSPISKHYELFIYKFSSYYRAYQEVSGFNFTYFNLAFISESPNTAEVGPLEFRHVMQGLKNKIP